MTVAQLWPLLRNQPLHSDGRTWPWPTQHYLRKLIKWSFRQRERLVRPVEITDGPSPFRFRCENYTEFARCLKMFVKEPGTCEWIASRVGPGDVFYDIGANIGVYTVLAARRVGPSGKVFAFEPHSATFARLLETISINGLSGIVTACNCALHEQQGFFPFSYFSPETGTSQSQLNARASVPEGSISSAVVELKFSVSLDSLIATGSFAPADHVKIDVDGNELMILKGMAGFLSGHRPPKSIQVEINPGQRKDILDFMASHGYAAAREHHTRKGAELVGDGVDPKDHAYNVIFQPHAK